MLAVCDVCEKLDEIEAEAIKQRADAYSVQNDSEYSYWNTIMVEVAGNKKKHRQFCPVFLAKYPLVGEFIELQKKGM